MAHQFLAFLICILITLVFIGIAIFSYYSHVKALLNNPSRREPALFSLGMASGLAMTFASWAIVIATGSGGRVLALTILVGTSGLAFLLSWLWNESEKRYLDLIEEARNCLNSV